MRTLLRPDAFDLGAFGAVKPLPIPDRPKLLRRRFLRFGAALAASRARMQLGKRLGGDVLGWHAASVRSGGVGSKRRCELTAQDQRCSVKELFLDTE